MSAPSIPPGLSTRDGMRRLPGGVFAMGAEERYPEEAPVRRVRVDPFWIDETPVTNAAFAAFVAATGHVTFAERPPRAEDYPGADPAMLRAGSAVFRMTPGPVPLDEPGRWWDYAFGASWRAPWGVEGPGWDALPEHPVVHVTCEDAAAYAAWAGKRLPSEAEWEYAARGGLESADFAWGDEFEPGGRPQANYWQGRFPFENLERDGWARTSPVRSFPPNGYGLFDMIGNVWEITADAYEVAEAPLRPCCVADNPRTPADPTSRRVMKGGSHLCAESYCRRYRPAARHPLESDTSTSHVGFRCVRDVSADR